MEKKTIIIISMVVLILAAVIGGYFYLKAPAGMTDANGGASGSDSLTPKEKFLNDWVNNPNFEVIKKIMNEKAGWGGSIPDITDLTGWGNLFDYYVANTESWIKKTYLAKDKWNAIEEPKLIL